MRFVAWNRQTLFLASSALGVLSLDAFVDDTDLNIVYAPANQWIQGATCGSSCAIQPDAPSVHDGTWHYATYDPTQDATPPSITYKFTATTIAVRNILPPLVPTAPTSHVELAFNLDGVDQPGFSYSPTGDSVFSYGGVVMSVGNLVLEEHTLIIRVPPGQAAVVLFDCFELTIPDPASQAPAPPPSSQSSSTTSQAAPASTTTTSSQSSSNPVTTTSSTTSSITSSPGSPSSTLQSSLHASALAVTSSGDGNGASNTQLPQGTSSTGIASNGASGGTATTFPVSSGTAAPQSQSAPSSGSSSVRSAAIGGAVGGGALLIVFLAVLCVLRVRRARRRRTSVGDEALSQSWETAGGAGDGPGSIEQFPYRDVGPTVVHRPRLQGFAEPEDPFADGSDYAGLLAPGTAPPEDIATRRGVEMSGSNLFARTAASLGARPPSPTRESPPHRPASLHQRNADEKAFMASSPAHASPHPPLASDYSDSTASIAHTERSSQPLIDPSPRLGEQLVEQLAALREEVAQMRQHREEAVLLEAPPRYDEA